MDDYETEILRANNDEHFKLHPCECYLLMVPAILHQNMPISPENFSQKKGNTYLGAQHKGAAYFKGGFENEKCCFLNIVRLFSIQVTQWLCHNETCRLYNCLTTYFISWCNIPCSRIKMSPICSGNQTFGPCLGDSCSLNIKLHG